VEASTHLEGYGVYQDDLPPDFIQS
jgi:hypothetical protein